jgi:O-antigen/teichoic acid export membrane protein
VASPAGNVMMVLMGEQLRKGRHGALLPLWHDTTRKLSLIFFPIVALLIVTAHQVIPFLYTEQYRASVPIFMIWTLAFLLAVLQTDSVLRVFAATRFLVFLNVIRLILVAGLFYILVAPLSLLGSVLATVLALAISKAVALLKMRALLGASLSHILPWRELGAIGLISATACAAPLLLQSIPHLAVFPSLVLSTAAYTFLYLALLFRSAILSSSERATLTEVLVSWSPHGLAAKRIRKLLES